MMTVMATTPLTQARRRQMTRDALIDAATDAFARRGISASSLDEIAAAAGFTRGAIYSNFGGKEDLLLAVVEQRADRMLAAMWEAHEASDHDHLHDAAGAAEQWRRIVARDGEMLMLRMELRLYALREPTFAVRLAELQQHQQEQATAFLLREAEAIGFTFRITPDHIAGVLIALTEGLLMQAAVDPENRTRYESLFEEFLTLLIASGTDSPGERA
jgi:AcrR family transcriptional regulator